MDKHSEQISSRHSNKELVENKSNKERNKYDGSTDRLCRRKTKDSENSLINDKHNRESGKDKQKNETAINKNDIPTKRHKDRRSNDNLSRSPIKVGSEMEKHSSKTSNKSTKYQEDFNETEEIWQKERGRFDQTEFSINDRFSALSISAAALKIEDNISVEIERNIRGKEPFRIPRKVDYSLIDVVRRPSDDTRFLMTREAFDVFKDLIDDDKRIIKMQEKVEDSHSLNYSNATERRKVDLNQSSDIRKDGRHWSRNERGLNGGMVERRMKLQESWRNNRNTNDNRRLRLVGKNGQQSDEKIVKRRFTEKPPDRLLNSPEKCIRTSDVRVGGRNVELKEESRQNRRTPIKVRVKERLGSRMEVEEPINKIRRLLPDGEIKEISKNTNELPDFSKRPGKYNYEVWKNKPEIIPRGPSYFEHDTRDEVDEGWGGRDYRRDGGFRGRGGYTGYRGRFNKNYIPQTKNKNIFEEWKHDKFEGLQGNRLTSTTEK